MAIDTENEMKKEEGKTKKEKVVKRDKSVFEILSTKDVSEHTRVLKVNGKSYSYLSWTHAMKIVLIAFPDMQYEVTRDPYTNLPYFEGEETGLMCFTKVTINKITREMWLPVLNGANKPMKSKSYTYKVKKYNPDRNAEIKYIDKKVEAADMFAVNTTIMRCLVKNLAMFGLGINIYSGEDLPLNESDFLTEEEKEKERLEEEKEKLDRFTAAAKERVEKYFEDPEDQKAIEGFEGAKKWATENNIKEVLEQISIYEKALKDVEDDDEAVQEKFNNVVGEEVIEPEGKIDFD
jgi:hypothetical protein